jgi:hypothetical protein
MGRIRGLWFTCLSRFYVVIYDPIPITVFFDHTFVKQHIRLLKLTN